MAKTMLAEYWLEKLWPLLTVTTFLFVATFLFNAATTFLNERQLLICSAIVALFSLVKMLE